MGDEAKPYLLTEASGLTGLSVDALRKRIVRKKLRASRSNEDGQWRVWLTSADVEAAKAGRSADRSSQDMDGPADESRTIKALEDAIGLLREQAGQDRTTLEAAVVEVKTRAEQAETLAATEKTRADQSEARAEAERARATQAEREREAAKVAAASAEGEVRGLREALAE